MLARLRSDSLGTPAIPTVLAAPPTDPAQQLGFLYKALDDTQNVIRALDAKAAFVVAVLSAMVGKVVSDLGDYLPRQGQPLWREALVFSFAVASIVTAFIVTRILFPSNNPSENCDLLPAIGPQFFIHELKPRHFARFFSRAPEFSRLAQSHAVYLRQVAEADATVLLQVMSAEVLKVAYIRQIKMDRLKVLAKALTACVALFMAIVIGDSMLPEKSRPLAVQVQGPVAVTAPLSHSEPVVQPTPATGKPGGPRPAPKRAKSRSTNGGTAQQQGPVR